MIYDVTVGKVQREKLHVRRQGSGWRAPIFLEETALPWHVQAAGRLGEGRLEMGRRNQGGLPGRSETF